MPSYTLFSFSRFSLNHPILHSVFYKMGISFFLAIKFSDKNIIGQDQITNWWKIWVCMGLGFDFGTKERIVLLVGNVSARGRVYQCSWRDLLTLKGEIVWNLSMSLNLTLAKNEIVKYYIKIKTHKSIILKFWIESGVNVWCDWAQVILYLSSKISL